MNGHIVNDGDENLWHVVDQASDASQGVQNRQNFIRLAIHGNCYSHINKSLDMEMEEYVNHVILNDDKDVKKKVQ